MKVWQVPSTVYKKVTVSLAELQLNVQPCGEIGNYLYQQMVDFNNTFYQFQEWPHGEIWGLGDSPTVGLLLAEVQRTDLYEMVEAPEISYEDMSYHFTGKNRKIRVYHDPNDGADVERLFCETEIELWDVTGTANQNQSLFEKSFPQDVCHNLSEIFVRQRASQRVFVWTERAI